MIEKPTVLVLGAGASAPYGYPLGYQLIRQIWQQLMYLANNADSGRQFSDPLLETVKDVTMLRKFSEALRYSGVEFIDAFLERNSEFVELGKLSIAYSLIPREEPDFLFDAGSDSGSWYPYLWKQLHSDFHSFGSNKLTIVTYNYDRSLEHYLFTAMSNLFGNKTSAECAVAVKSIPIIHLHGMLGEYPFGTEKGRRYFNHLDGNGLIEAAQKIRIISEPLADDDPNYSAARSALEKAERIAFLGFGYHSVNMTRLQLFSSAVRCPVYGTAKGLTSTEKHRLRELYGGLDLPNNDWDVYNYLRNEPILW